MLKIAFKSPSGADASYWRITEFTFTGRLETINIYDEKDPTILLETKQEMRYIAYVTLKGYYDEQTATNTGNELMTELVTIVSNDKDKWIAQLLKGAGDSYEKQKDIRPFLYQAVKTIDKWKTAVDVIPTAK